MRRILWGKTGNVAPKRRHTPRVCLPHGFSAVSFSHVCNFPLIHRLFCTVLGCVRTVSPLRERAPVSTLLPARTRLARIYKQRHRSASTNTHTHSRACARTRQHTHDLSSLSSLLTHCRPSMLFEFAMPT